MSTEDEDFDINSFNKTFSQLKVYIQLVEETHLKERLSYKRALTLCRTLLKECRLRSINNRNMIDICETVVHPCVTQQ